MVWPYTDATCIITRNNKETTAYIPTQSTTQVSATGQQVTSPHVQLEKNIQHSNFICRAEVNIGMLKHLHMLISYTVSCCAYQGDSCTSPIQSKKLQ